MNRLTGGHFGVLRKLKIAKDIKEVKLMQGMTQKEMIREHLLHGLSITPAKALVEYGTMRLAAYIHELRQEGIEIETLSRRSLSGRPYGEYRLVQ
jgi:hypothetical protein